MQNKKELLEDLGQLKSELRYLTSLYGHKMSLANQLDEDMHELDMRRDSIKRQIYDIEVLITDTEGA